MSQHRTVASLFVEWPSLGQFADDLGVSYGAAKQMRRRNSIPVTYWIGLLSSPVAVKAGITAETLVRLHTPADVLHRDPTDLAETV